MNVVARYAALRKLRKGIEKKLAEARGQLREVLTLSQEAVLAVVRYLDGRGQGRGNLGRHVGEMVMRLKGT